MARTRDLRLRSALLWAWPLTLGLVCYRGVLHGQVLGGRDLFRMGVPDAAFLLESLRNLEWPLWNPYIRLGQPFLAALQTQALYPPRVVATVLFGPVWGLTIEQLFHAALTAGGTWVAARVLGRSRMAAGFSAVAFTFSVQVALLANEPNLAGAVAWTGWVVATCVRCARRPWHFPVAVLAAQLALDFFAGSPETLCWQLLVCAAAVLTVRGGPRRRAASRFVIAAGWALALSAVALLPALELVRLSSRASGVESPLSWSTAPSQLLAVIWPLADRPRGPYWSDEWLVAPFLAVLPGVLAIVSLRRSRRVLPWVFALAVLAVISLGGHAWGIGWLLSHPPFSWFRYPAKALPGVGFCLVMLAAIGLDRVTRTTLLGTDVVARLGAPVGERLVDTGARNGTPDPAPVESALLTRRLRRVIILLAAAIAVTLVLALLARVLPLREGARDGIPWIATVLLASALAASITRGRMLASALGAIVTLELVAAQAVLGAQALVDPAPFSTPSPFLHALPAGFEGRISADLSLGTGAEHATAEQITSFLERSRQEWVPQRFVEDRVRAVEGMTTPELGRIDRFLATGAAAARLSSVAFAVRSAPPGADAKAVLSLPGGPTLYALPPPMPRGWLVHRVTPATDKEVRAWLENGATGAADHARTSLLGSPLSAANCPDDRAEHVTDGARTQRWKVTTCSPAMLVMNDAFAPGWSATVDGQGADVERADFALRGVRVPAGSHDLELRYRPVSFTVGAVVSAIAWWMLGSLLLLHRRRPRPHAFLRAQRRT